MVKHRFPTSANVVETEKTETGYIRLLRNDMARICKLIWSEKYSVIYSETEDVKRKGMK